MKAFRFLYINCYAFLLAGLAIGIVLLPMNIFLLLAKIALALMCAFFSGALFWQWKGKARKIPVLVARNKKELRPDTFKALNQTFCGMLMASAALADLRKTENYQALSAAEWEAVKHKALGRRAKKVRRDKNPPLAADIS